MEEVQGRPVSDVDALDRSPVPRHELARRLLRAFLDQVLSGGIYHADPHPGNVLLDESGTLWWIDFGSVGFLDPVTLDALQTLALGISLRDPALLTRAVRRMSGEAGDAVDARALEFDLGAVLTDQLRAGGFDPRSISTVLSVMTRYGLEPPRSLTLLSRAMLTLEGTLRLIDPPFALAEEARASLSSMPMTDVGDLNRQLQREAIRALPSLRSLPENVEELALQLRTGRLVIGVDRYSGPDGDRVETWLDRLVFATLGGAGLLSSAVLLLGSAVTPDQTTAIVLRWVGFLGLVVSSTMQMRAVAQLLRRRRGDLNRV